MPPNNPPATKQKLAFILVQGTGWINVEQTGVQFAKAVEDFADPDEIWCVTQSEGVTIHLRASAIIGMKYRTVPA